MGLSYRHKAVLIVFGVLFLTLILSIYWFLFLRAPSGMSFTKVVVIKKGMPLKKISVMLEQEGIIANSEVFVWMATVQGKKTEIKAGEYEFRSRMSLFQILDTLVKGQVKRHLVTTPEGYTLSQVAELLDDLNIVEKKGFLEKASSPVFISSLGLSHLAAGKTPATLEGYLFPDTYHFMREMNPEEVLQMMVQKFRKVFGPELVARASQLGISQREAVIIASIIEKETSLPEEKPLVSAVFHNRLKKRIPLQSCSTVIYGIKNFNGNLTKADLQRLTPYNTYLLNGLPPTPICNPGRDSILAALHPSPVSYLYFVSKNDGSHYFSSNIEEHNRAVWKYQKYSTKNNLTRK